MFVFDRLISVVSVVLPLALAMLTVVLERLVLVKGVIADAVVVAVVSVSVSRDVVIVAVGLTLVVSVFSPDVVAPD